MHFVPLRKRVVVAATLAALAGLSAGALYLRPSSAETKPAAAEPRPTPVPVATVVQSEVAMWDEFSGRLEAVERVDLRSRVAGAVQSVHFVEGALVKRDDLLVTIDPAPYAAEVERAQAQVVAAQAGVTYTKSEHERAVLRALKDLPQGIPVERETAGGTTHRGRLQLIDNQVNARSGTVRVRAVFDNKDGSLIPGQFAKLRMGQAKTEPALLVSERAVGTDQNKRYVMVVGEDNKAAYREITLGGTANGQRIVTSGLKPGERIIVNGLQRVRPGTLVAPQVASAS